MADSCRIISGSARGVRLATPAGNATRPLSDRVKQSLFGALEAAGALDGSFLDLFAGSGGAGIEALSRGALAATFVESDAQTCALIKANLAHAGLDGGVVVRADVLRFLADPPPGGAPYGACLIDPPYDSALVKPALERLGMTEGWLLDDATVVAKHFWRTAPGPSYGRLNRQRERRFGETMLTFYTLGQ